MSIERLLQKVNQCLGREKTPTRNHPQLTTDAPRIKRRPEAISTVNLKTLIRYIQRIQFFINNAENTPNVDLNLVQSLLDNLQNYIETLKSEESDTETTIDVSDILRQNLKIEHGISFDHNLQSQIDIIIRFLLREELTFNSLVTEITENGFQKFVMDDLIHNELTKTYLNLKSLTAKSDIIQSHIRQKLLDIGTNPEKLEARISLFKEGFNREAAQYEIGQLDLLYYTDVLKNHLEMQQTLITDTSKSEKAKLVALMIQLEILKTSLNSTYIQNIHYRSNTPNINPHVAPYTLMILSVYYTIISLQFNSIIKETE